MDPVIAAKVVEYIYRFRDVSCGMQSPTRIQSTEWQTFMQLNYLMIDIIQIKQEMMSPMCWWNVYIDDILQEGK